MNDFVFKETPRGLEFVGDFEGLYKSELDPWGQSGATRQAEGMDRYYDESRHRLYAALAARVGGAFVGLEVGCGHGHALAKLARGFYKAHWVGMDISMTAILRARELYPDLLFFRSDITRYTPSGHYDVVIWNQILWYVLGALDQAVTRSLQCLRPGGLFVVSQAFLREQRYGRQILDGFDGARNYFAGTSLLLEYSSHDTSRRHPYDDGLLVYRTPS